VESSRKFVKRWWAHVGRAEKAGRRRTSTPSSSVFGPLPSRRRVPEVGPRVGNQGTQQAGAWCLAVMAWWAHAGVHVHAAFPLVQVFSMDAQRKIRWDDAAVDGLLKQFDEEGKADDVAVQSKVSLVLDSFKVGLTVACCSCFFVVCLVGS
jgi:hypothetical protein